MGSVADDPGHQPGQHQNGENPYGNVPHIGPEAHGSRRIYHRNDERDEQRSRHIDNHQITHRSGQVAPQPVGDDPRRRCRGADETQHGAFYGQFKALRHMPQHQGSGAGEEAQRLYQQRTQVPSAGP